MFGTEVEFKDGVPQDPCAGDSGGPLMYQSLDRWIIIGWLEFKCKKVFLGISQKKVTNCQGPSKVTDMIVNWARFMTLKGTRKEYIIR